MLLLSTELSIFELLLFKRPFPILPSFTFPKFHLEHCVYSQGVPTSCAGPSFLIERALFFWCVELDGAMSGCVVPSLAIPALPLTQLLTL